MMLQSGRKKIQRLQSGRKKRSGSIFEPDLF